MLSAMLLSVLKTRIICPALHESMLYSVVDIVLLLDLPDVHPTNRAAQITIINADFMASRVFFILQSYALFMNTKPSQNSFKEVSARYAA